MIKRLLNRLSSTRIILILFITILPQSIWAEDYNYGLTIAGNTVTSENANDILGDGDGGTGSVSFDQSTNTLTLTNVSYMSPDNFSTDFIVNGINTLTIFIIGENAVRCSSFITSDTGGEKTAVFATNTNNSGTLSIESTASNWYNNHTIDYQNGLCVKETGENSDYHSTLYDISIVDYNLIVGGVSVTSANATNITGANVSGSVSYAPSTNTLTLNGASINGNIVAEEDLVVCFIGENTMQKTTNDMLMFTGNGNNTLTFETNESNPGSLHIDGMTDKEYLTGNWKDCPKTTYDVADGSDEKCDWWAKSNSSSLDIVYNKKYQIWLKGHQVTDATTFDSGVSYDREGSVLSYYGNYESYTIKSSLPTLTINIESGDYKMKAISFEPTEAVPNGTLTFNLSYGDQASLTLNNTDGEEGVINGFSQVILNNPLIVSSPDNFTEWTNSIKTATIGTATVYNIRIAGNVVSELNKNDVLGDGKVSVSVSNDGTGGQTYTLTLDNATITPEQEAPGIDYMGSSDLTIRLNGNNIIQGYGGCEAIRYNGVSQTNPYLYFVKDDNQHCSLELIAEVGKNEISGFHTNYDEHTFFVYSGEGNGANTYSTIYSTTIMGGTGSTNEPHIIASANDLKKFVEYYNDGRLLNNANVRLDANINCNGVTGFVQLADNTDATFRGVFDGNNKTISNLTLTGSGLFGYIEGGTVKDLTLSNYHLTGNSYPTGGIVAELSNGATISNCSITNSTIACAESQYNPEVGGIAARMSGSTITGCIIDNVQVKAETTYTGGSGASANAGGIVASASGGAISSCLVRNGSKITNFYADEGATLKGGAIVGSQDGTTLNQNKYDYDVIVEYGTNADNKIIKSGYTQRGVGGKYYDEDSETYVDNPDIFENKGAVLYTKPVVLPAESPAGTVTGEEGTYYSTVVENDVLSILVAPHQTATIIATPGDTYYTPVWLKAVNGETPIATDSTDIGVGGKKYFFTMPDAEVTVTAKFAIDLSAEGIITTIANASYTGEAIEPTTITVDGITDVTSLTNGTDFTITGYTKSGEAVASPISVGTYTVSIEGKGNYTGIKDISFTIDKGYAGLYFYRMDGAQESPVNTVQSATYGVAFDSPKLKNPHNLTFTLSCKAENSPSAAESDVATIDSEGTLTILKAGRVYVYATTEGNANYEAQTEHYVLNIDKTSLNNVTIADIADKTFTGSAIEPAVTVTLNGEDVSTDDYSVSYINNINVSTDPNKATITLTAKSTSDHFTEGTTKTATFNIVAKSITDNMIQAIADQTYSFGNAITPTVTVKDGETTLTLATTADDTGDYSIAYSNNTNAAKSTDETAPTVTITGKGNYTGTASKTFTINPMAVATATISLSDATLTYNGAAQHPTISSIKGENSGGSTLEFASSDYTVSYEQNDNTLTADDVKNAGGYTLVAIFGGNYIGTATTTFNIAAKDLSDAATIATIPDQTYTGNEIKPEPAVSIVLIDGNDATTLTKGTDFDYSYANNINASEQAEVHPTVTITGKGNYTGSASQTFSITNATMTVTATGYNGTYDGNAHGITVVAPEGATVTYGTKKGTYDKTESPTYTDAGSYMVHYQVVKTNYATIADSAKVEITKATPSITFDKESYSATYGETFTAPTPTTNPEGLIVTPISSSNTQVATVADGAISIIGIGETTITVSFAGNNNYEAATTTYKLNVAAGAITGITATGYTGTYDGNAHGITVTAPEGASIKYGTKKGTYDLDASPTYTDAGSYMVHYQVERTNYATITDSAKVEITKANPSITFDKESYSATYGETFTAPTASTNPEGLTVTATSSSNTQVATISDGVITIVGVGETTITVSFAGSNNYEATTATYKLNVAAGTIIGVTATGYYDVYDGKAHGITVTAPEGATIKYGTKKGTYNLNQSPTYSDAGTYMVHYQVECTNYTTLIDSVKVEITKANITPSITLEGWTFGATANTPEVTGNTGNGAETFTYKAEGSEAFTSEVPTAVGTHIVKVTIAETTNYNGGEATATFTIINRTFNPANDITFAEGQTYASFYSSSEDLELPEEGIAVFIITGLNGNTLTTQAVSYIPKGVPVLVMKASGTTQAIDPNEVSSNMLQYATSNVTADGTAYILYNGEYVRATGTIPAGKCYLKLNKPSGARKLTIGNETTGIDRLDNTVWATENWFDLNGRRIEKPTKKGLYIMNGKKVVVK